ncbi:pseudouridine-5'-phosphatase-like isoform X2 [Rhodnius prolixus]|uniref:pseudouridine-5'-phosphatase-like isoform X2 n=1 Tax=Rhodnius prolixus TaxID=13249 RepID=UPI003D187870
MVSPHMNQHEVYTVPFYTEAHMKYLAKYKRRYADILKLNSIGLRDVDSAKYLIQELDLPMTPPVYAHGVWQDLRTFFPKSKMVEGAMDLICHFYNNGIPAALVTSSDAHSFKMKIKSHKSILKFFCHVVLGDDPEVKHGKPAADIYNVAAKRFINKPSDYTKFLVIEKSVAGIQAARAAGMQAILLREKSLPKRLFKGKADLILDNLKKIDLRDFDLPRLVK